MPTTLVREDMKEQFLTWLNAGTWETLLPDQVTDLLGEPMVWVPYYNPEISRLYRAEVNFILFTIRLVVITNPDVPRTAKMTEEIQAMQLQLGIIAQPVIGSRQVAATVVDDQAPAGWARDWRAKAQDLPVPEPALHP